MDVILHFCISKIKLNQNTFICCTRQTQYVYNVYSQHNISGVDQSHII